MNVKKILILALFLTSFYLMSAYVFNKAKDHHVLLNGLGFYAERGYFDEIQYLLERGRDPNSLDENGRTPLFSLIQSGREFDEGVIKKSIYILVKYGADVNAKSKDGTPLITEAVKRDNLIAARLLFDLGANPKVKDSTGHEAAFYCKDDELRKIIISGK